MKQKQICQTIKSALVYKGLEFSAIFTKESEEKNQKPKRHDSKRTKEKKAAKRKIKSKGGEIKDTKHRYNSKSFDI